jgi:uncharacterized membrane protein YkoI
MRIELVTLASLALAGTLTACSNDEPSETATTTTATPTTAASSTTAEPTAPTLSVRNQSALDAIKTAEKAGEGAAVELDADANRWDVSVLDGQIEREIDVSDDGKSVIRKESDAADADDIARLQSVKRYIADAVKAAIAKVPGDVDEADLESRKGKVVWEVSIDKTGGGLVNVFVDADTGEVVD